MKNKNLNKLFLGTLFVLAHTSLYASDGIKDEMVESGTQQSQGTSFSYSNLLPWNWWSGSTSTQPVVQTETKVEEGSGDLQTTGTSSPETEKDSKDPQPQPVITTTTETNEESGEPEKKGGNNVSFDMALLQKYAAQHGRTPEDLLQSMCIHSGNASGGDGDTEKEVALPNMNQILLGTLENIEGPKMPIYESYLYNVRVSGSKKPWKHVSGSDLWGYSKENPDATYKFTQVKHGETVFYSVLNLDQQ